MIRIGTAGWAIPAPVRDAFPSAGSLLKRYASRFPAVEINSSFHRSHRPATYGRWAASVPADFRFAVKVPKAITHERRLLDCDQQLSQFLGETSELRDKIGPMLVQLPPSLGFDAHTAKIFFAQFRDHYSGKIVCEPRHGSWFTHEAEELFLTRRIARAAADPAPVPDAARPGGFGEPAYFRLHGSPSMYRSAYGEQRLRSIAAAALSVRLQDCWIMFDNTASGAAAADALLISDILQETIGRKVTRQY
jgi:uncharacterized protein YecE (DUF72 family)